MYTKSTILVRSQGWEDHIIKDIKSKIIRLFKFFSYLKLFLQSLSFSLIFSKKISIEERFLPAHFYRLKRSNWDILKFSFCKSYIYVTSRRELNDLQRKTGIRWFFPRIPKFLNHAHLTNFRQIFGRRPQQRAIISRMLGYCVRVTSVRIVCTHRIGLFNGMYTSLWKYRSRLFHVKNRVTVSKLSIFTSRCDIFSSSIYPWKEY